MEMVTWLRGVAGRGLDGNLGVGVGEEVVRPELGGGLGLAESVDHLVEPLDEGAGQVLRLRRRDVRRYHCNG